MQGRKICVAGLGAVGSVLAAMLGKEYSDSLTLIARGKRKEAMEQGIVMHSQHYGEVRSSANRVCETAEGIGEQDIIFICVKNYSLEQIAETLRPAIGSQTVVVPVMNGVEAGDYLRSIYPQAIVCDSVIYTNSGSNPDFSVTQTGSYTYLFMGSKIRDQRHLEGAKFAYELLKSTGFDARWADDIESEIWQKFIFNCAYNTITARYLSDSEAIRSSEAMRSDLHALLTEGYLVGVAEGIRIPNDLVEKKYQFVIEVQPPNATSSMRRDMEAHRRLETDAFTGAILRKAQQHDIEVPVTARYQRELLEMQGLEA